MSDAVPVIIYIRTEYHLCDEAETTIHEVAGEVDVTVGIDLVNVDSDKELHEKYGERIPYIYVGGRPAFRFRVDADRLEEELTAARE